MIKKITIITILLFGGLVYFWLQTPLYKEYQENAEVQATSYIVNNPDLQNEIDDWQYRYVTSVAKEDPEELLIAYTTNLEETVENQLENNDKFSTFGLLQSLNIYLLISLLLVIGFFLITTIRSVINEKKNNDNTA